ncbi:glycosyltransferase family 2 protein [Dongia soli]|uniref:Glycosyltransferase family 2 protein n=1 Tax=Dongia soli TaxID=600628 RepID=A0ABU5EDE3_9PROT|nr:glycosyltransferase family 2 protein [Dongia soli]MDY0884059.1 glycosyltransferase family 2 protein [Dongia soli]
MTTSTDMQAAQHSALKLSIITPIYNEEENIPLLFERLDAVLRPMKRGYEIIMVNDGSRDGSLAALRRLAEQHPEVKVIDLKRNSGQTAALMCGIDHSTGDIIIPIDADLQNDPADIPNLLVKIDEGYDVVSGWRRDRKDAAIRRNFVSSVANLVISRISGVHLRDYGCSLKAYRRSVLEGVRLYGEMHRFVPIYASWMGAKITEIPVRHHPRLHGKSSYGLERVVKVILDLIVVKFLDRHLVKPIYVFGGFGMLSVAISFLTLLWALYLKLVEGLSLIQTPLPLLSAMAFLIGITAILLGLMSEILVRTYFESQDKRPYYVRERINL